MVNLAIDLAANLKYLSKEEKEKKILNAETIVYEAKEHSSKRTNTE